MASLRRRNCCVDSAMTHSVPWWMLILDDEGVDSATHHIISRCVELTINALLSRRRCPRGLDRARSATYQPVDMAVNTATLLLSLSYHSTRSRNIRAQWDFVASHSSLIAHTLKNPNAFVLRRSDKNPLPTFPPIQLCHTMALATYVLVHLQLFQAMYISAQATYILCSKLFMGESTCRVMMPRRTPWIFRRTRWHLRDDAAWTRRSRWRWIFNEELSAQWRAGEVIFAGTYVIT